MRGYAKKRDKNEPEIIAALRDMGCTVWPLDQPCDLLIGFMGKNLLQEVKMPGRENRSDQRKQQETRMSWLGRIDVVTTPEESVQAVKDQVYGRQDSTDS